MKGWPVTHLAAIADKITDGSHNPPKGVPQSDFLMLSSKNVFDDDFHYESPRYLTAEQFQQENKRTKIAPGDVLLTIVGTIGRSAVVPHDAPKITLQRSVAVIRPKQDVIIPRFLMYSFIRRNVELNEQARGVAQKGIYLEALRELEVEVPPLPEQQRIVGILDAAFDGIATAKATAEQNLKNARALFESNLQSVFTQGALSNAEGRGEGWVEIALGEICQRLHQGLNTAGEKVKFYDSGYPIIQTRNIDDGVVELDSKIKFMCEEDWQLYKDKYRPEVGDVFFTNIGTIGKTAIITIDRNYLIHWNIFKLRPYFERVTSEFLRYTLEQLTLSGYFEKLQKGGTVDFVTKKMISEALEGVLNFV